MPLELWIAARHMPLVVAFTGNERLMPARSRTSFMELHIVCTHVTTAQKPKAYGCYQRTNCEFANIPSRYSPQMLAAELTTNPCIIVMIHAFVLQEFLLLVALLSEKNGRLDLHISVRFSQVASSPGISCIVMQDGDPSCCAWAPSTVPGL
nr:hypothetical protein CFP56_37061 [Quercus suber]